MSNQTNSNWPELPLAAWQDTRDTLQLWTQVIGKIRLSLTPWLNHSWHVPLYVTARGLGTSPIFYQRRAFEIEFDFIAHVLHVRVSDGGERTLPMTPQPVADFYVAVLEALATLGIKTAITDLPCEIEGALPLSQDRVHRAYDANYAQRFWRVLVQTDRVMKQFRTRFIGKCSPVHFFWGSFDLAVTRFSGRRAPAFAGTMPGVDAAVMREAYSHEVSSAGFWPGATAQGIEAPGGIDYAAFYSYSYPVAPRFHERPVEPTTAFYSAAVGEFLLPYEALRTEADPDAALLAFFQSTYEAAAISADWNRAELECAVGKVGVPRNI